MTTPAKHPEHSAAFLGAEGAKKALSFVRQTVKVLRERGAGEGELAPLLERQRRLEQCESFDFFCESCPLNGYCQSQPPVAVGKSA